MHFLECYSVPPVRKLSLLTVYYLQFEYLVSFCWPWRIFVSLWGSSKKHCRTCYLHGINKEMCRPTSSEFLFISTCNEVNDKHKAKGEKTKQNQRKENKTIYTYICVWYCSDYKYKSGACGETDCVTGTILSPGFSSPSVDWYFELRIHYSISHIFPPDPLSDPGAGVYPAPWSPLSRPSTYRSIYSPVQWYVIIHFWPIKPSWPLGHSPTCKETLHGNGFSCLVSWLMFPNQK